MAHGYTYETVLSEEIASAGLSHDPPGIALTKLHSERLTKKHDLESVRGDAPTKKAFQQLRSSQLVSRFRRGVRSMLRERMRAGRWSLTDGSTLRLAPGGAPLAIRCVRGTSLVTQEGDPIDHVLEAGGELVTRPRGVVVVWALSESEITAAASRELARGAASWRTRDASPAAARTTGRTTA